MSTRSRRAIAIALVGCCAAGPFSVAGQQRDLRDMKTFRFAFDNDAFVGSDDGFSAGSSVQIR